MIQDLRLVGICDAQGGILTVSTLRFLFVAFESV